MLLPEFFITPKMRFYTYLLAILICSKTCIAQDTAKIVGKVGTKKTYKSEFGFKSDNDAYLGYGQDRYYTNGLFLTFRHALKQPNISKRTNK
ncbi:MAG: hypothetical protein JWQ25_795, partial [Daejeonella sp.]|nr:hypothetical protein [Daejeonella sp.]